jgi:hypothetical protein
MKNKKEIHKAVLDALKAVEKAQAMLTPEVISWANETGLNSDDEIAYDIHNFGLNLTLFGQEIEEAIQA